MTLTIDAHIDVPWIWQKWGLFSLESASFRSTVSLKEMERGGLKSAIFAIYLSAGMQDRLKPGEVKQAVLQQIEWVFKQKGVTLCKSVAEAEAATNTPIFLGMEGGRLIQEDLGWFLDIAPCLQYLTLTHNENTTWAGSSMDLQSRGLSEFGRMVIATCEAAGVLVDVSHASDETIIDVLACARRPVIASHSGCRTITKHPRNLTDEQIKAIAHTGGMVCVPFARKFVGDWPGSFSEHIYHIANILGDCESIGVGSDIDGAQMINSFKTVADWDRIVSGSLETRGFGKKDIAAISGGNLQKRLRQTTREKL